MAERARLVNVRERLAIPKHPARERLNPRERLKLNRSTISFEELAKVTKLGVEILDLWVSPPYKSNPPWATKLLKIVPVTPPIANPFVEHRRVKIYVDDLLQWLEHGRLDGTNRLPFFFNKLEEYKKLRNHDRELVSRILSAVKGGKS